MLIDNYCNDELRIFVTENLFKPTLQARDVSDHYPVEVTITTGRVNLAVPISSGIEVRSEIPAAANMLTAVNSLTSNPLIVSYFNILQLQIDNR